MSGAKFQISLKYEVFELLIQNTNVEPNKNAVKLAGKII
jgi:hypothetical protein